MTKTSRSGYTKTGFSRSFSCCSFFSNCSSGKGSCYYAEIDPEVKDGCRLWLRHHKDPVTLNKIEEEIKREVQTEKNYLEEQQLSLF